MLRYSSAIRKFAPALAGVLYCAAFAHAQTAETSVARQAARGTTITVAVDGLLCGVPGQVSFEASSFQVDAVSTGTSAGSGGGAGKTVLSNVILEKAADGCSMPLWRLGSTGQHLKKALITETDKDGKPILTVLLEDVRVAHAQFRGADSTAKAGESVELGYFFITVTDAAGNSTGRMSH